jgi:hypothetical protein
VFLHELKSFGISWHCHPQGWAAHSSHMQLDKISLQLHLSRYKIESQIYHKNTVFKSHLKRFPREELSSLKKDNVRICIRHVTHLIILFQYAENNYKVGICMIRYCKHSLMLLGDFWFLPYGCITGRDVLFILEYLEIIPLPLPAG